MRRIVFFRICFYFLLILIELICKTFREIKVSDSCLFCWFQELEDAECIPIESTRQSDIEIQSHGPDIPEDCPAITVPPLQLSKPGENTSDKLRQMEEEMKMLKCQNARVSTRKIQTTTVC